MDKTARSKDGRTSKTLPSSPSSHHSSSDFEFSISLSPHNFSSYTNSSIFCPADELFFKGQILPLHLSPRLSMVESLSLSSSSATSSTTTSRDSTDSSNDLFLLTESCNSSRRQSSVTDEDEFKRFSNFSKNYQLLDLHHQSQNNNIQELKKPKKYSYFSFARFSNVFGNESKNRVENGEFFHEFSVKRMSKSTKEMMTKYINKVNTLYEKLSQNKQQQQSSSRVLNSKKELNRGLSQSFSENFRYPRKKSNSVSSCPSSMRSSPNRVTVNGGGINSLYSSNSSSMEELNNAIQGAISHCKKSSSMI